MSRSLAVSLLERSLAHEVSRRRRDVLIPLIALESILYLHHLLLSLLLVEGHVDRRRDVADLLLREVHVGERRCRHVRRGLGALQKLLEEEQVLDTIKGQCEQQESEKLCRFFVSCWSTCACECH